MTWRKDWPKEFRQQLKPLTAEVLHEDETTFIFMDADILEGERIALCEALPANASWPVEVPTRSSPIALGSHFAGVFENRPHATSDDLRAGLALLSHPEIQALQARFAQIHSAIWHVRHYHGRDFEPTRVFAVSPVWRRRWETLIGGILYPAYIAVLDVNRVWHS